MKFKIFWSMGIGSLFLGSVLWAADAGYVSTVKGTVDYQHSGISSWTPVKGKVFFGAGDSIRTGDDGQATLIVDLQSKEIHLSTGTTVSIVGAPNQYNAHLKEGQIACKIKKLNSIQSFQVVMPVAVAAVRGTAFDVRYIEAKRWGVVEVTEGSVEVTLAKHHAEVKAGQRLEFAEKRRLGQPTPISQ